MTKILFSHVISQCLVCFPRADELARETCWQKKFGPIDGAIILVFILYNDPSGDAGFTRPYDETEHKRDRAFDAYSRSSNFGGGGKMHLSAVLYRGELIS